MGKARTMNDSESSTSKKKSQGLLKEFHPAISAVTALLVAFSGAYTSYQSTETTNKIENLKNTYSQSQFFTEQVEKNLSHLTGENTIRAKIALTNLYILARVDNHHRYALIHIAFSSDNPALVDTMSNLINNEIALDKNEIKNKEKLKQVLEFSINQLISSQKEVDKNKTDVFTESTQNPIQISRQQALATLSKFDTKEKLTGWIYLGSTPNNSINFYIDDKTISSTQRPRKGNTIVTTTNINLRDSSPINKKLGNIKNVVRKGSELKIKEIKSFKLKNNRYAVWGKI